MKLILLGGSSLKNRARNSGFDPVALAKRIEVPVLVIDKTNDPSLAFVELQKDAGDLQNFKLVEISGDTHHYEDIAGMGKLVREFLGAVSI